MFFLKKIIINLLTPLILIFVLSGCVLTKVVTVPMRVGGAVISIIPVAGNTVHSAIDESAELIDEIPL